MKAVNSLFRAQLSQSSLHKGQSVHMRAHDIREEV